MNKKSMLLAVSLTATFPALDVSAFAKDSPLEAGLKDDVAWDIVESMTTEVGQRQGGIDLQQDGTKYFDLHHTPDDTLDKVDKSELRQNVAAWAATLALLGDYEGDLKPEPKP